MALIGQYALSEAQPEGGSNTSRRVPLMTVTNGAAKNGDQPAFSVTADDLELFAQSIRDAPDRLPFDFDHSFAERGDSRAAGWILPDTVEVEGDKLYASVEWTPTAAAGIRNGEWRYVSPEFNSAKRDDEGTLLEPPKFVAAALTNRPFFKNLGAVTLSEQSLAELVSQRNPFRLIDEQAAARLAAHFECDPLDIVALAGGTKPRITQEDDTVSLKAIAGKLKLAEDADEATILAAIDSIAKPAPGVVTLAQEEATKLRDDAAKGLLAHAKVHALERTGVIEAAIRDGKILPAQKESFEKLYDGDPEGIVKLLDATPAKSFTEKGSGAPGEQTSTTKPEPVEIDGSKYEVDPESHRLAEKTGALLAADKITRPTTEQYLAYVDRARAELASAA